MTIICEVCGAKDDALLCVTCTNQLEKVLAELPARIRDLELTASRQAHVSNPARILAALAEHHQADAEERLIPARLRTKQGRITLPATSLPFDTTTARLHGFAVNAVGTWARHLAETRGVDLPQPPARPPVPLQWYAWRNRLHRVGVEKPRPVSIETLCTWLVSNIESIRLDEAAAEIHGKFVALADAIDQAIDRHDPDLFAGRCKATSLRFENNGDGTLTPIADECGERLYADQEDREVECGKCGATYDVAAQKKLLVKAVDDVWARPQLIADGLTSLDQPVNAATLRKWIERDAKVGQPLAGPVHTRCEHGSCGEVKASRRWRAVTRPLILQRGIDDNGKPLYRVGDVRTRIAFSKAETDARISA